MSEKTLENTIAADFAIWLQDEMNKLNMDADHFGSVLYSVMYGKNKN